MEKLRVKEPQQLSLLPLSSDEIAIGSLSERMKLTPIEVGEVNGIPAFELDISFTISELAYLTHSFYRYYGKYPSVLGGHLIDRYAQNGVVFDNYMGCGTSLVEAAIRGIPSSGIDVNPLAVLATKVKTKAYHDLNDLENYLLLILRDARNIKDSEIDNVPKWRDLAKWFTNEAVKDLAKIQKSILRQPPSSFREFATVCFLSIIRRCSNAYDGEVRPHVNPKKLPRPPIDAFKKKAIEMLHDEAKYLETLPKKVECEVYCASNTEQDLSKYLPFGTPSLTISHPPYLNCFNYYSVFSLENHWSKPFIEVWNGRTEKWVRIEEHIAWPATNERILNEYFGNLRKTYTTLRKNVSKGSILAIVIGDATIRKKLIPVHTMLIDALPEYGFRPVEMLYRTTHYGIGKYAYRTRADYHGNSTKKDGVIIAEAI